MKIRCWSVFSKRILLVALILTAWVVVTSAGPLARVATAQEPDTVITIDATLEELKDPAGVSRFGGSMSWEEETPFLGERESWHLKKFAALVDEDGEFNLHIEFDLEAGTFSGSFNGYGDYGQNMDATFNGTMAGTVWPEGEWEAWEFSGTTQIDAIYHAQGPGLERTEHLEIETEISGEIKCWKSQMDFNIEWNPPNKDFVLICKGCPLVVEFPSPADLKPEELDVRLGCQPTTPSAEEQVVCTADVSGAGENESLEFQWYLDGNSIETTQEPTWRWKAEETGTHQIGVQVVGDDRSAEATVTIEVSEKVEGVTDTDGDSVPDDEDLCPDEAGQEADGCPAFGVRLGCQPDTPAAGDAVICTADVLGAHEDETFEFHWYLDSAFVETTSGPAWTWGQAKAGPHDIGIQVVGEGRSAEADFTLTAGAAAEVVADRDGDGIPDDKDACRDQYAQTEDGCPTEAVAPVAPAADDGKPTSPSGVSNLVRNLEEFLAGQGVQGPTPGQAAGGAAAVSTLIGAWVLTNLLSGVSREDLLRAVHAWRHRSATPAPTVKPVPGNIKTSPPAPRLPEQPPEVTMTTKHPPMAEKKSPAAAQKKLERPGLISDEAVAREDRIKGGKAVIENTVDLLKNLAMNEISELQDIVTLKKQFDKNGNFILKSMDDLENTRKQLVKQIERGRKLRISDKLKKVSAGVSHALEVFDGIDHVMKVGAQRGYKGVIDYGCAVVAESGHKFILYTATKHPIAGLVDGLVSMINPDYNVESWMRSAQDHWHDVTREYFDNIYTNDDAITNRLHQEFQRHKDRIMRADLSDAEKLKRIKRLYKILLK